MFTADMCCLALYHGGAPVLGAAVERGEMAGGGGESPMNFLQWADVLPKGRELALRVQPVAVACRSRSTAPPFESTLRRAISSRRTTGPVAAFLHDRILPGSEVWNAGANVGVYVLQAGAWVGAQGRVLAFEANPNATFEESDGDRVTNGLQERVEDHARGR